MPPCISIRQWAVVEGQKQNTYSLFICLVQAKDRRACGSASANLPITVGHPVKADISWKFSGILHDDWLYVPLMFIASFSSSVIHFKIPGTSWNGLLLPLWCLHATCPDKLFTSWIWRKVKFCGEGPWHLFAHDIQLMMGRDIADGLCHHLWLPQSPGEAALSRVQGSVTSFLRPRLPRHHPNTRIVMFSSCNASLAKACWAGTGCGSWWLLSNKVSFSVTWSA